MKHFLDFEKPIADLEHKIEELRHLASHDSLNISQEISKLQKKAEKLLQQLYKDLSPWQKVQIARHPERPQFFDYLTLFEDFQELCGDRLFADDQAIVGGLARFQGCHVVVMGQQKGKETQDRIRHNFGMAKPEGYRKVQRLMNLAQRFSLPIITFVDTAGAYPGIDAEERGQAEAIARCIEVSLSVQVPIITVIIGEGGSGGAIALATANNVIMLEHAIYSVISPEGCASILWRSADKAQEAATALRLTSKDLFELGVIDKVIKEPVGGAHRHLDVIVDDVGKAIFDALTPLLKVNRDVISKMRRKKFVQMGTKGL